MMCKVPLFVFFGFQVYVIERNNLTENISHKKGREIRPFFVLINLPKKLNSLLIKPSSILTPKKISEESF